LDPRPTAPVHVDPDHDGDNDTGVSAATEASRKSSFGPAANVTLSPAAQALLKSR